MRKIVIIFIVIIFISPATDAATVLKHIMTKDPKQTSACDTPVSSYSFTFNDEVYSWVLVEQGNPSDMVGFVWYDALGGSHCQWYKAFGYQGIGCPWESLCSIDPSTFQYIQGVWHVDFYYNDIKRSTVNFLLTLESSPCPAELVYGEYSEETELLRNFRDQVLLQTPEGHEIINLYYQWSPVIVKSMEEDAAFKAQVKEIIDGVLPLIR